MNDICAHPRTETRRRQHSNGTTHIVDQCCDCGTQVGNPIPKTKWLGRLLPSKLTAWDDELLTQYHRQRTEDIRREYEDKKEKESQEWWANYNAYLRSPAWRALRGKVLQRDDRTCQGCGRPNVASQVHHLHYDRVGHEMMFDLVSVCDACHEAIHADKKEVAR
jgi:5-methylcytosine-specific restriction endonuclease McrA